LVFLSQITKTAQATVERSVQEAGAGTPQRILIELLDAGDAGMTAASLADALGVGVATVGKYLKKDLEKKDYVHSVVVPGSAAAVWKIGAPP
jgi:predicted ArsR family transcriptional regulator